MTRASRTTTALVVVVVAAAVAWWLFPTGAVPGAASVDAPHRPGHEPAALPRCVHPYVPTIVGTVLEYAWTGQGHEAEITMRLERARERAHGVTLVWSIETRSEQGIQRATLDRECGPDGAEEPWLGVGVPESATLSDQQWRMPPSIAVGDHYGGTYRLAFAGLDTTFTQMHEVGGEETIEIDGSSHHTTRIAIAFSTEHAQEPLRSVAWVERDVGLVRLDLAPGTPLAATYELRSIDVPRE